jgi:hypothetical protein
VSDSLPVPTPNPAAPVDVPRQAVRGPGAFWLWFAVAVIIACAYAFRPFGRAGVVGWCFVVVMVGGIAFISRPPKQLPRVEAPTTMAVPVVITADDGAQITTNLPVDLPPTEPPPATSPARPAKPTAAKPPMQRPPIPPV